jgi:hypothetical protein
MQQQYTLAQWNKIAPVYALHNRTKLPEPVQGQESLHFPSSAHDFSKKWAEVEKMGSDVM